MSRALALEFVAMLLADGYTIEQAESESCKGYDACDESGRSYVIRQGTIKAPWFGGPSFRFRTLANEIAEQPKPIRAPAHFEQLALI